MPPPTNMPVKKIKRDAISSLAKLISHEINKTTINNVVANAVITCGLEVII